MAKRSKKQLTPNQVEYAKEVKRIQRGISRAVKRGYRFIEDVLPQTPKRITQKALQELREIKGNKLYEKAQYLNEETGKVVSGLEGRKLERQASARKGVETRQRKQQKEQKYYPNGGVIIMDNVVDEFIAKLQEPEPPVVAYTKNLAVKMEKLIRAKREARTSLLSLTYSTMAEIGKNALGWRLQPYADTIQDLVTAMLFRASEAEDVYMLSREIAEIIKGEPLTMAELQELGEQDEYNESYELPE